MSEPHDTPSPGHLDHGGITCQQLVELVTAYLDRALPTEETDRFEQHLRDCPPCLVHLEHIRTTVRLTGTIAPGDIDPEVRGRLLEMFRDWRAGA